MKSTYPMKLGLSLEYSVVFPLQYLLEEDALEIFPYLNYMLGFALIAAVELAEQQYLTVTD